MHPNTCSLHANLEHLKVLIANLDLTFDIIGISETWKLETNQNTQNTKIKPGYHRYCGTKGRSLNSKCGFFVKEGLKFIERNDLTRKISNEAN